MTSIPRLVLEKNPYITALAQIPVVNLSSFKGVVREPGSTSRHDWSYNVAFEVRLIFLCGSSDCFIIIMFMSSKLHKFESLIASYGFQFGSVFNFKFSRLTPSYKVGLT